MRSISLEPEADKHWLPKLHNTVQFSSAQFLDRLGRRGDMRDDLAEILFQSSLQEALVSCSGMGGDDHSLMLPIQHFLWRPRRGPASKVPWRMVLERLQWHVTCPNHASFRLLTVPVDPQRSWSCSTPSRWPCAPSRIYGEFSLMHLHWQKSKKRWN